MNTGGPAFPFSTNYVTERGMSLRDYFAAKAMQGYLSTGDGGYSTNLAKAFYAVADAMLKERET